MAKLTLGPTTHLMPKPAILVGAMVDGKANFMTVAWGGIAGKKPPAMTLTLQKAAYTVEGIEESGVLSVNVPSVDLAQKVDFCGLYSGRKEDKAAMFEVTIGQATGAPLIGECPLNFECRVIKRDDVDRSWLYLVEIVETHVEADCLTDNFPDPMKINPLIFTSGVLRYHALGEVIAPAYKVGKKK